MTVTDLVVGNGGEGVEDDRSAAGKDHVPGTDSRARGSPADDTVEDIGFPSWPHFDEDDIDAVGAVLRSGRVNVWTGPDVSEFEEAMAHYFGRRRCVALSNGSVSLEIALRVIGVGPGDDVVVTPRSFFASASCVVNVGATPVFADVDIDSQNITANAIERVLTPRTKAIVPVHLAGWPCEMDDIMSLAEEYGLSVIEDCAQAHGARHRGRLAGSFGTLASWSFCQNKIISTGGEGGALATDSEECWERIWSLKEHGKAIHALEPPAIPGSGYRWLHDSFGSNSRMTGMQAVLGKRQLRLLDSWVSRRRENAEILWSRCREIDGIRCPEVPAHIDHACYVGYAFVEIERLSGDWSRDRIMQVLATRSVPVTVGSCPELYRERAFQSIGMSAHPVLPNAHELGLTSLSFPTHHRLSAEHMHRMADDLRDVMRSAVR